MLRIKGHLSAWSSTLKEALITTNPAEVSKLCTGGSSFNMIPCIDA